MTLTLTLREQPDLPLGADDLVPDRLAGADDVGALPLWHGKERARVGDFFAVSGAGDDVRLEGDLSPRARPRRGDDRRAAHRRGRRRRLGRRRDARRHARRARVRGAASGRRAPGEKAGMRGGEIVVHGDAGEQAGAGLRRGLIAVGGRVGEAAGLRMLAGTLVALGDLGPRAGAGMRRGSIVTMAPVTPLPTFAFACSYRPPFLRLYLRRLRALGLAVPDDAIDGRYARWCGDGLELRRGEILILEPA